MATNADEYAGSLTIELRGSSDSESTRPHSLWHSLRGNFHLRPPDDDEPQDWWIASTAIPLVAATAAPLANVMSIVALVMPWRNNVDYGTVSSSGGPVQQGFPDPHW